MRNVEFARDVLNRILRVSVERFRYHLSTREENRPEVDFLFESDTELRAKLIETVLEHLGHKTQANGVPHPNGHISTSRARRVAAKL